MRCSIPSSSDMSYKWTTCRRGLLLGPSALQPRLLGLYILLGALGVPFWALCSKRFDKRRTLAQATLLQQPG